MHTACCTYLRKACHSLVIGVPAPHAGHLGHRNANAISRLCAACCGFKSTLCCSVQWIHCCYERIPGASGAEWCANQKPSAENRRWAVQQGPEKHTRLTRAKLKIDTRTYKASRRSGQLCPTGHRSVLSAASRARAITREGFHIEITMGSHRSLPVHSKQQEY